MANQTLMRIDSFIKLQLYARCFPLLEPRRLKVEQDTAWGGGLTKGQQRTGSHGVTGMYLGSCIQPFWDSTAAEVHILFLTRLSSLELGSETGNLLMESAEVINRSGRRSVESGDHRVQWLSGSILRPRLALGSR